MHEISRFSISLWSLDIILVELKEEEKRKHCFLDILSVGSYNVTIQGQNMYLPAIGNIMKGRDIYDGRKDTGNC